jgi:diadenosine tetraphosphate (Ap4A) HIT family hydrolase
MPTFTLHPRLAGDTFEVTRLTLSRVLLMNDRRWPWVILVPERAALRELFELEPEDAARLMAEIVLVSTAVRDLYRPHKINVAALGNQVEQLHVHVIGRFLDDPAWPKPVWGKGKALPYHDKERDTLIRALQDAITRERDALPHPLHSRDT